MAATGSRAVLSPWHITCLQWSLAGNDEEFIAKRLGKKVGIVRRFLRSEWAQKELAQFHTAVLEQVKRGRVDPIEKFQDLTQRAIDKLEKLLGAEDEKVQFLTACRILDNAGLAPTKRLEISGGDLLKGRSPAELALIAAGRISAEQLRSIPPGQPLLTNGKVIEGESQPA